LVRIRDDKLRPMPGVTIHDMGRKMGQNGVDNGKLAFREVRVPRDMLLNRVVGAGREASPTDRTDSAGLGPGQRVGGGRADVKGVERARALHRGPKPAAVRPAVPVLQGRGPRQAGPRRGRQIRRHAALRGRVGGLLGTCEAWRGGGGTDDGDFFQGESDTPILEYGLQQRALLPLIARTYAVSVVGASLLVGGRRACFDAIAGMTHVKDRFTKETCDNGGRLCLACRPAPLTSSFPMQPRAWA
jgi:hypothetical protein